MFLALHLRILPLMRRLYLLMFLVACSHDAKRENPLDPELTPAVALTTALSDSTGSVTLQWSHYAGDSGLADYRVLRREAESTVTETLAVVASIDSTRFIDTGLEPDTAYEYRVVVTTIDGYEAPSEPKAVAGFKIGPVSLQIAKGDPQNGVVDLRWTRYRDPGFAGYEVIRRQVGTDLDTAMYETTTVEDTVFTDTTALHGVSYLYTIRVEAAGSGSARQHRLHLRNPRRHAPRRDHRQ